MTSSVGAEGAGHPPRFCSEISRENHEPLGATASRIDHWLLVEYRGLWGPNALRASGLSEQVKERLREQIAAREHSRLLFVRRPDRRRRPELRAYAATSREGDESLRAFTFEDHEDLRELDLTAGGDPVAHPLFVVCTHGKHDPCCARRGRPLYEALAEQLDPGWVWQSTHVGGDRFAGNLVCLPHGIYYGRVAREDAVEVLDDHLADRIALAHYRGRSCHAFGVQAAERDVRERAGLLGVDDLRLERAHRAGDRIVAAFRDATGELHEREVVEELGPEDYLTCAAIEQRRPRHYRVTRR